MNTIFQSCVINMLSLVILKLIDTCRNIPDKNIDDKIASDILSKVTEIYKRSIDIDCILNGIEISNDYPEFKDELNKTINKLRDIIDKVKIEENN